MSSCALIFAALWLVTSAAPPQLHQLQQINALDYYLDHPELHNYYSQQQHQQKQGNVSPSQGERLESLEPDSEVELLPGAQPPQQPPQQSPVAPNLPGLAPGQRVFIVHMPIPGYRPGTIGGYQPVYIVAAAPQGNPGFPGNGYQNAVLLNPSNQVVAHSGYPRGVVQGGHPGLVQGANPLLFGVPQNAYYQDPGVAYHQAGAAGLQAAPEVNQGSVRLAQLINLRNPASADARPDARPQNAEESSAEPTNKQHQPIVESKEGGEERRNVRPTSAHAQPRLKA